MKLLHAADLHLDSKFAGLPPEQAAIKREQQRELLDRLSAQCRARGCQILLLSGDLFDGDRVYRETVEALTKALETCGAEVFIAPGNHDYVCPGSPYLTEVWPQNVHIFTAAQITSVTLPELNCRIYGAGFHSEQSEAMLEGFCAEQDGLYQIMVLHGEALAPFSVYNPITAAQIAASGLDYLALGHVHKGGSTKQGKTLCAWPGCTMGRGFDETGEHGALEVTVSESGCRTSFVPLCAGKYEVLSVKVGEDPLTAIQLKLPADTAKDVYRIVLKGESAGVDLSALQTALSPRFFGLELQDKTVPPVDLWAAAGEETLKGAFLRLLKAKYDAAVTESERGEIAYAARTGLALMEHREVPQL